MEQFITSDLKMGTSSYSMVHAQTERRENILGKKEMIKLTVQPENLSAVTTGKKPNTIKRMDTLYYSFLMSFLKENHPEILRSIDMIYEPDLSRIGKVVDSYCEFVGIPVQQIMGEYINYKDIQHRYKAIAVVLRIFQPEKLDNLKTKVKSTIYKELAPYLKINSDALQKSIICACNQFDMYSDFKKDIKQAANYYLLTIRFNSK
ncbi:hypothetical protein HX021_09165 [Sphingobacterium sp. N143]|uniref:hypothetical protein n=1 Tax=Sphingobacterium sp. N143 TaxID=2746727 RepID=UPI00257544C4|nr:hypothetical protein [Sphingobacterium sp. N143]MDM1294460.1 hypothetical protein [Sphingobacterium sp. N143]